jgi:hypothetical protein
MRSKSKFALIGAVFAAACAAVIVAPTLTLAGVEEEEKKKDDEKKKSEAQIQKEAEAARTESDFYARAFRLAQGMKAAAEGKAEQAQTYYDASRKAADNARNNNLSSPATIANTEAQAGIAKAALDTAQSELDKASSSFVTAYETSLVKRNEASKREQALIDLRATNEAKSKFALQSATTTQQQSATSSAVPTHQLAPDIAKVGAAWLSELKRKQQASKSGQQGAPPPVPDRRLKPSRQSQAAGQAGAPNAQYEAVTDVLDYQNASTSQQKK